MKVITDTIGDTTVFIQTMDDPLEIVGGTQEKPGSEEPDVEETGIADRIRAAAYYEAKSIIREIAGDIGAELAQVDKAFRPKQTQMEFNVALSAQGGVPTILSGKGDYVLKVTMIWEPKDDTTGQTAT